MATIKDIANRLGVSVSTVSKGLNGASDISDELRQMVLDTVYHLVFIQESQDLRFWAAVWYAFIWEICLCKMQESYSVFHFLQLRLHWQN